MNITPCANPVCNCMKLVIKINLLKPVVVEEISGFMVETNGVCTRRSLDYWDMRTLQINWGASSEVLTIHRLAMDEIVQLVFDDVPF